MQRSANTIMILIQRAKSSEIGGTLDGSVNNVCGGAKKLASTTYALNSTPGGNPTSLQPVESAMEESEKN